MIQFYSPEIKETLKLCGTEALHCFKVLRKKEGDIIYVTDGHGCRFECRILNCNSREVNLEILNSVIIHKNWRGEIILVVAPTKNADRMAWLVEKCTEIGIDKIIFVKTRFSERKTVNIDRLRRIAESAMNQSLKTVLPEIMGIVEFDDILSLKGEKYFGYCDSNTERSLFSDLYRNDLKILSSESKKVQPTVNLIIGPEGDFSGQEVKSLLNNDFRPVTFGDERLRTETAAIYGITAIHILNDIFIKN